MKHRYLTVFLILLLPFGLSIKAQSTEVPPIDLGRAIELTLQNQPVIRQAEKQVEAAGARVNQANTFYSPNVEASASYFRIGPVPEFELPGGLSMAIAPENNYDAHISLQHTLYDFGRRDAQTALAGSLKNTASDNVEVYKSNLTYQTIQVFYSILFLKESIRVKDQQLDNLSQHLQITEARIKSGTATDFDLTTTQTRAAAVRTQRIDIQNELQKQEITLRNLMGFKDSEPLNLKGELSYSDLMVNPDSLFNAAENQRNEMKLAKDAEETAARQKTAAGLTDMPSVAVAANYGIKNGFEPNIYALRGNWAAGLVFRYPVYNGKRAVTLEEEAEANLESAKNHTRDVEQSINAEIKRAVSDLKSAQEQVQTAHVQAEHAQKALQRAELQYRDGIISNMDLLDVQTALTEARLSELQVAYKNILSGYLIKRAAGDRVWMTGAK
ncbi:MAG: TolC family protein [Syntrophothermus sp.]